MASSRFIVGIALAISASFGQSLSEAEALLQQERLQEAEEMLRTLSRRSPRDVEVRFRLAYVLFRMRLLDASKQEFASIVREVPPALSARYFLGRIALEQQQPRTAIEWLLPVVQARDLTHDAASQLALAFAKTGQLRKAIEPINQAIQREPWDGRLYYRLGRLRQQLKQPELARESLQTAARLMAAGRESIEAVMTAGREFREGRRAEGLQRIRSLDTLPAVGPNVLVAAGILCAEVEETEEALSLFERAAKAAETQFSAQFNYGLALLRVGRADAALDVLGRAATLLPQSQDAQIALGLAAVMARRYDLAIAPLGLAHGSEPGNTKVRTLLATAYLRTGKPEAAAKLLQPVIANAEEPAPSLMYVEALQTSGKSAEAIAVARRTYERYPQDLTSAMTLVNLLTRAGLFAEARPVFAAIIEAHTNPPPEAVLGLADCLQKAGEHAAAIEKYRHALMYKAVTLPARLGMARSLIATRQLDEARRLLEEGRRDHGDEAALYVELARVYARLQQPGLAADATRRVEELKGMTAR